MNTDNSKLFAKIVKVMGKCRTLEKTGKNTYDRYDYVTADVIATRIGALLAENGIAFLPSMVGVETSEYTTQKGGSNFRTVAHFQMTLACAETGATYTSLWTGEAIDRSDKSISKAAVSAVKYFLLKTFLLAGGDEEDADSQSPTIEHPQGAHTPFDEPAPERASQEQLKQLGELGQQFYGAEWAEQLPKLTEAVSKGATSNVSELLPIEATKLIDGIRRKMAQANGTPK